MASTYAMRAIADSDKHYWHRYTEFYRAAFDKLGDVKRILEFGVFHGASIRWLSDCFPAAEIVGVDILPVQPDWPAGSNITYKQVDQADRASVRSILAGVDADLDLIIEDGSHIPQHQANCLAEGLSRLKAGGAYILEDICTSHPLQPAFAHYSIIEGRRRANALNVLMAFQHLKDTHQELDAGRRDALADPSFFSQTDLGDLFKQINRIEIFKRTQLPVRCYACGESDFDYVNWQCRCGTDLYHPANSMTALIWRAEG